jgi:hypothetical protein
VLPQAEEAMMVGFRRPTLLPLDDVLRCLVPAECRHGISRLPHDEGRTSRRKRFADPASSAKAKGKLFKLLAIDRASPMSLFEASGAAFLR